MRETVNAQCKAKVSQISSSAWASPCFVAYRKEFGKKRLDGKKRKVCDYRKVNALCTVDCYPIPALDQLLDEMKDAAFIGAIDLKSGYWQVPVCPGDEAKTAFVTQFGLYEYCRAPFGYRNAPAHFMRCVDSMLRQENIQSHHTAFVDDITTHGRDWEEYIAR